MVEVRILSVGCTAFDLFEAFNFLFAMFQYCIADTRSCFPMISHVSVGAFSFFSFICVTSKFFLQFISDLFIVISVGGNVKVKRRNDDDEPILSSFGEDLLYINVGFAEQAREELLSHRNPVSAFLSEANRLHALRRQIESLGGDSRPQSPLDNLSRLHSLFYLSQTADVQYPATSLFSQQEYGI